jgi:hypothetical protein
MTIKEFNQQSDIQQANALRADGVLLAKRMIMGIKVYLYQIGNFYVEVYFNSMHNMIQGLRSFENTNELDPYLCSMPLPDLSSY